jgi:mannose-1-phosphate guanylyltransferase
MTPNPLRGVLILAGGRGERFWPWSTAERPKQLLPLAKDGRTLLAATFARALRLTTADQVVVMTSEALRDACQRECPGARILGEPMMRNTAPAIAGAVFPFAESQAFAVLPADHAIDDEDAFTSDMERAFQIAERDAVLVTFGIPATAPDPNFGYIQRGAELSARLHRVARFTEKPTRETAAQWLATGLYAWNSGMFVWRKKTFFDALTVHHPDIAALRSWSHTGDDAGFAAAIRPVFEPLKGISVDYAVLEHAPNTVVLEASFDWDDLGSWQAWARRQPRDAQGNVCWGDAVPVECRDCIVVGDGLLAAPLRLEGMVVVATAQGVLACRIEDSELVRKVSEAVRARKQA